MDDLEYNDLSLLEKWEYTEKKKIIKYSIAFFPLFCYLCITNICIINMILT